jgi:hypothetical protein
MKPGKMCVMNISPVTGSTTMLVGVGNPSAIVVDAPDGVTRRWPSFAISNSGPSADRSRR